jgi:hypothetical protein
VLVLDAYLSFDYSPSFLRSATMLYFLNIREQLYAKNSSTPLFYISSPYLPFCFEVEELKHLSLIYLT